MTHTPQVDRNGLLYGAGAYLLWGIFPLYWPLLQPAGTTELIAQRMIWSLLVIVLLLALKKRFAEVLKVIRNRRQLALLTVGVIFLTCNWSIYIWAVNHGHVIEGSLGYFINPLMTILLGVFVRKEKLRSLQWLAVAIGAAAIAIITLGYGRPPWLALAIASSFALYGLCKKQANVGAIESLGVEMGITFIPACLTLLYLQLHSGVVFGHHGVANAALIASTGIVTVLPLLLFAASTRRLPLSILGFLQYLAPIGQFSVGVWIRHEQLPPAEFIGFLTVWGALVVLSVDGIINGKRNKTANRKSEPLVAEPIG